MSAQADPWQVITDVTSALPLGGQTASIRCTAALRVLDAAGIDFSGNPVKAAAAEQPASAAGFEGYMKARGYNPDLTMVCSNFGPGDLRDAFEAGMAAQHPAPGHLMVMRGTIALRDAEIELLRGRLAELSEALTEAAGHVEPLDQNSELAIGRWLELAKRYRAPKTGADGTDGN